MQSQPGEVFLVSSRYHFLFTLSYVIDVHISYAVNLSCLNKRCCCCCCYVHSASRLSSSIRSPLNLIGVLQESFN